MRLPVLHLSVPTCPCALFVNGALLGHSMDEPVLPVSPDGTVFITCLPIAAEAAVPYLPLTVCFSLYDGLPDVAVYGCTLYLDAGGAMDVCLHPAPMPVPGEEELHATGRASFSYRENPHAATLYYDNGWRIAIEDTAHDVLIMCQLIHDFVEGQVQAVHCFSQADVYVTGRGSRGPRSLLFTPQGGQYVLVADENASSVIADGALLCTQPLWDTAGHEKQYSLTLREEQPQRSTPVYGHLSAWPASLSSPAAACTALCEAVALNLEEEALALLAPELREGMTLSDLIDFFGNFAHVHAVSGEGPYTLTLSYALYENVYRLQSYLCEMDGLLIANIMPQE